MTRSLKFLLLLTLLLVIAAPALASIDLVEPEQDTITNQHNITFEYYPSMPGIQSCTLDVSGLTFPDSTITNNDFNSFTVVNIDPGEHLWSISCSNATDTEYSVARTLIVDHEAPQLTIITPVEASTVQQAILTILVSDNQAQYLTCAVDANSSYVTTIVAENATPELETLDLPPGMHQLSVNCTDNASNSVVAQRSFTLLPELFLTLDTDKLVYDLGETVELTIDSLDGAEVDIEVCPNEQGFVQCYTPLVGTTFPQVLNLPYANNTGEYIIDGVATLGNQSVFASHAYMVDNSMRVEISADDEPEIDDPLTLTATTSGAVGEVRYHWELSNGSTSNESQVTITYDRPGTFTETVTATDEHDNNASANYTFTLLPTSEVTVKVKDRATDTPLQNASVQFQEGSYSKTLITDANGEVLFLLETATYDLFVSKPGYGYYHEEVQIKNDATLTILLDQNDNAKPVVTINTPEDGATSGLPLTIGFTVQDLGETTCRLSYAAAGDSWLQEAGTMTVPANGERSFEVTNLEEKAYTYYIECEDGKGNIGESDTRTVTITTVEESTPTAWDEDPLEVIDRAYGAYDSFTAQQKELADLLGWEDTVKDQKRVIERAQRDRESLRFRNDLSEAEKQAKGLELDERIATATSKVPLDLAIIETQTQVTHLNEAELGAVLDDIIKAKGYTMMAEELLPFLNEVQQSFTKETTLTRAMMHMADGIDVPLSMVSHSLRYKGGDHGPDAAAGSFTDVRKGTYTIIELLPASMSGEITALNEHEVLQPAAIEFGPEHTITYYVNEDLPLETLASTKTVLLKKPSSEELEQLMTGNATLTFTKIGWKLSLILTIALFVIILLVKKLHVLRHLRYLLYAESRKQPLHNLKVIINDGFSQLEAGNLEQSMMRYKEAKLSYDKLSTFAKNEGLPELLRLHASLDKAYFEALTQRITDAIRDDKLHEAIDDYARLEGTFEQLGPDEQARVMAIVIELGKRLGLGGDAA